MAKTATPRKPRRARKVELPKLFVVVRKTRRKKDAPTFIKNPPPAPPIETTNNPAEARHWTDRTSAHKFVTRHRELKKHFRTTRVA